MKPKFTYVTDYPDMAPIERLERECRRAAGRFLEFGERELDPPEYAPKDEWDETLEEIDDE